MEVNKKAVTMYTLKLQDIKQETKNTYTFYFPKPDNFFWDEGASIHLGNRDFDIRKGEANKNYIRHFSIVSLPDEGNLKITTRIPDIRSEYKENLIKAKIGDTFTFFKPGNRMKLKRVGKPIILISAGVAIATTRSQIRAFSKSRDGISGLHHINIDSGEEYLFRKEITDYVSNTKDLTNVFVNCRSDFYKELEKSFQKEALYFIVGGDGFVVDVANWLLAREISQSSIVLDKKKEFYENLSTI